MTEELSQEIDEPGQLSQEAPVQYHGYVIPMDLDHLVVDGQLSRYTHEFAGQLTDFSLLPHAKRGDGALPRIRPNISEDLVSKPFEATNEPLELGVHLHWTLPKEFRRVKIADTTVAIGEMEKPQPKYRDLPNRWLIERHVYKKDGTVATFPDASGQPKDIQVRKWIIASNFLANTKVNGSRAFPNDPSDDFNNGLPNHRYLGRVYDYDEYAKLAEEYEKYLGDLKDQNARLAGLQEQTTLADEEKLQNPLPDDVKQLSAFGYGEPLFAAYYPECRNVLGFHDDLGFSLEGEVGGDADTNQVRTLVDDWLGDPVEIRYFVAGWYDDAQKDPLTSANFRIWTHPSVSNPGKKHDAEYPSGLGKSEGLLPFGVLPESHEDGAESKEDFFWFASPADTSQDKWMAILGQSLHSTLNRDRGSSLFSDEAMTSPRLRGRSVLVGRMHNVLWPKKDDAKKFKTQMENTRVALANTPGQALAALLGAAVPNDDTTGSNNSSYGTEMLIDALQLGLFEDEDRQDFPARLESGLHEAGFNGVLGEGRWIIRLEDRETAEAARSGEEASSQTDSEYSIPESLTSGVKELNRLQIKADQLGFKLKDLQQQFYADWYKYMLMEYDFTLNEITIEAHVNQIRAYLAKALYKFRGDETNYKDYMGNIQNASQSLLLEIVELNAEHEHSGILYRLLKTQGPRYWSPKEPVILLQGEDAVPAEKYRKRQYRLPIQMRVNLFEERIGPADIGKLVTDLLVQESSAGLKPMDIPWHDGSTDNWSPLFMDWQVETFPFTKPSDKNFHQRDWPSDSIVAHYDLHDGEVDLRLQKKSSEVDPSEDLYSKWIQNHPDIRIQGGKRIQTIEGRSILTSNAHKPLVENLKKLLAEVSNGDGADLIRELEGMPLLSQSLSGFNDALLMRKQILQLKVRDPLAQAVVLREFTDVLRTAIARENDVAPLPSNLFLPVREGAFRIRKLRLVDMWGRTRKFIPTDLNSSEIVVAEPMKPPEALKSDGSNATTAPGMAYFPPRIVQPARLDFRWQSTHGPQSASGDFMSDGPICGYVLPNFLDQSLHIFSSDGIGLGVIARSGAELKWTPFPGSSTPTAIADITDASLQQLTQSIVKLTPDFLTDFLQTAQDSMGATQPENYAQFDGMALLVGRPLALVRASLNLQLRGLPAVNNSWNARETVYQYREHQVRPSMGFDRLRFAVRLGERFHAGDGLFAYYIDQLGMPIEELYSPYAQGREANTEQYWNEFGVEKNALRTYQDRLARWRHEVEALESEILAMVAQLQVLRSGGTRRSGADIVSGMSEEQHYEQMIADKRNAQALLMREIESLELGITGKQDKIDNMQKAYGYYHGKPGIFKPHSDHLTLSLDAEPVDVMILMDPRSAINVTTGILPVKKIDIPVEQFADALNNIQIAFLTTPVVSPMISQGELAATPGSNEQEWKDEQKFYLVTPNQPGFTWSWLQPDSREHWQEVPPEQLSPPPRFVDKFAPQAIFEGWMKLSTKKKKSP